MVVFDAAALTLLLWEKADSPIDPTTKLPVTRAKDRIDFLVQNLQRTQTRILIPTPVLAEVLVQSGAAGLRYVQRLQKAAVFEIADFGTLAAVELAEMTRQAVATGDKKLGETAPWQKIKVDRQIIAIARVSRASVIYTDDGSLARFAARQGMTVVPLHHLPLPSEAEPESKNDLFAVLEAKPSIDADDLEIEPDAPEIEVADAPEIETPPPTPPPPTLPAGTVDAEDKNADQSGKAADPR